MKIDLKRDRKDLYQPSADARLRMTGRHHEIYLGDPRRVAPERLRTVLRQPVAQGGNQR